MQVYRGTVAKITGLNYPSDTTETIQAEELLRNSFSCRAKGKTLQALPLEI